LRLKIILNKQCKAALFLRQVAERGSCRGPYTLEATLHEEAQALRGGGLAEDQVVGATGAVLEGDPGWVPEETSPVDVVRLQSDWYDAPLDPVSPRLLPG